MKPAIPPVRTGNTPVDLAHAAVKQTLDSITGQARNAQRLDPLPATATLADVVARVNLIQDLLQR